MENLISHTGTAAIEESVEDQTKGLEQLEFLADKAKRLLFQLEDEEAELKKLRTSVLQMRQQKKELIDANKTVREKLTSLEADRETVDGRISKLLEMIGELDAG